jgi:hypothetical protein
MELTRANVESLGNPLYQVWNAIGPDCYDIGEDLTPELIIEMCFDANRLSTFVDGPEGQAAEELVSRLIRDNGYDETLAFLAKEFPMC